MTYTGADGAATPYPWFSSDGFTGDDLADPAVRNQFIEWLAGADAGGTAAALRPDVAAMFKAGYDLGHPG